MTLDDLEKEFWGDQREQTTRVRLARVVRAMRGVIDQAYSEGRASKVRGDNENVQRRWVDAMINEILGGDAEEAAGGPARKDGKAVEAAGDKGPVTVNSPATDPCPDCGGRKYLAKHALNGTYYVHCHCPKLKATDPAPAVCVWTSRGRNEPGFYSTPHGIRHMSLRHDSCVSCGKPITFTEANHG